MKPYKIILSALLSLLFTMIVLFQSCMKDKLDFEKMSNRIEYNPKFDAPLIKGSFSIEDLVSEETEDSVLVFRGEEVIFFLRMDSIYSFDVSSLVDIPEQSPYIYHIPSGPITVDIPIFSEQTYTIEQKEDYEITLTDNMRLDSAFFSTGYLQLDIVSTFNIEGTLRINISSVFVNNEEFDEYVPLSTRTSGEFDTIAIFPLENAVLAPDNSLSGFSYMDIYFTIYISVTAGDTIKAGSYTEVTFSIESLEDFNAIFGYAGDKSFDEDTVINIDLGTLEGVSGTFAITNPKINVNYTHSFGVPVGYDMKIKGFFEDGDSVILNPDADVMNVSSDYLMPEVSGKIVLDNSTISNIDDFLVFPPPEEIGYEMSVRANPDGDTTVTNFVLYDSKILLGMEVEIPLEFRADLQFRDTLINYLREDIVEEIDYIEYARLYYIFRNEFPINLDPYLILYDSITDTKIDTIILNETGNNYFINAAPVDSEGETIIEEVRDFEGMINLDEGKIYKLLNDANKLIIVGKFSSFDPDNVSSVKILKSYSLDFKFGIDIKIHYTDYMD